MPILPRHYASSGPLDFFQISIEFLLESVAKYEKCSFVKNDILELNLFNH